ncbi:hypothetical protein ALC57_05719 [Trachymyrmex cornetzi]|uniref:Uncharacterized protein n=1 Tax=Trachymyrmex cornetzi TaxID=471704 RepID=A0A151JA22_9HYME|nr:hypothetical protein ALC57_05719 [Trachymyrmex cornetzi]
MLLAKKPKDVLVDPLKMLFKIIYPIYYINKFLYEITYNTRPNDRKRYRSKYPICSLTCKDVFVARQMSGVDSAGMKDSNEGILLDACLDDNNEDYEKRITTELLGKPNFIVDLMDTPGDFIPTGSPCSKLYGTIKTVTYNILLLETDLLL